MGKLEEIWDSLLGLVKDAINDFRVHREKKPLLEALSADDLFDLAVENGIGILPTESHEKMVEKLVRYQGLTVKQIMLAIQAARQKKKGG